MKLPQGYEPHEPADYTGPLFIEGQMRAVLAREAKLRDALTKIANNTIHWYSSIQDAKEALDMPADDSALKEALKVEYRRGYDDGFLVGAEKGRNFSEEIKQAKREALLEAAEWIGTDDNDVKLMMAADELRSMAEEFK